jgi:aldehyde:ferredoxin oxidoreductase
MIIDDPIKRILYVDLSRRRFWIEEREDLFRKYLGGVGVAIQLLNKECKKGANPLGPENPIIFAIGQLNGLFPMASKTVALFKSPLTGNLGESHGGGRSAIALRMAGYGCVVIKGSSETPVYLVINEDGVKIKDASVHWGMGSSYAVGRTIREREKGRGIRTIMRIGKAGEKLVSYSCVITETYRHFGRLGLGAVFGSKNLKALMITGKNSLKFSEPNKYKELYKEIFNTLVRSPLMKKYHDLGTSMNILPLNELGALPTENLNERKFQFAEEISGEAFAENNLGRRVACSHCPISCIHIGALREPYESDPYFYKTKMISYDYELNYALGSMLGVGSRSGLLKLIEETEIKGLDAMSTGVVLAWATEMQKKGLINTKDTEGLELNWNDYETYIKAIKLIVNQPNNFFKSLAKGVDYASNRYKGKEFALSFGGNEMPGYHTGPATYISYLTGSRHSHLDSAGYSIDQALLKKGIKPDAKDISQKLIEEETWRQILSSLIICFFARNFYTPKLVNEIFNLLGYNFEEDNLKEIGKKILKAKYDFKIREGFNFNELRIPEKIYSIPTPLGNLDKDLIENGLKEYEKIIESIN